MLSLHLGVGMLAASNDDGPLFLAQVAPFDVDQFADAQRQYFQQPHDCAEIDCRVPGRLGVADDLVEFLGQRPAGARDAPPADLVMLGDGQRFVDRRQRRRHAPQVGPDFEHGAQVAQPCRDAGPVHALGKRAGIVDDGLLGERGERLGSEVGVELGQFMRLRPAPLLDRPNLLLVAGQQVAHRALGLAGQHTGQIGLALLGARPQLGIGQPGEGLGTDEIRLANDRARAPVARLKGRHWYS